MSFSAKILEIACFSAQGAQIAQSAGAHRIELCANYITGGITPVIEDFHEARKFLKIPLFIMIRPRPGDFNYQNYELTTMERSIIQFKSMGADGFVFGVLNKHMELHESYCEKLVRTAFPLPCTLHRAFDLIDNKLDAIYKAYELGFTRVLTSGGKGACVENLNNLENIFRYAKDKISIIAGGNIRSTNLNDILAIKGIFEYHSSAITSPEIELPSGTEIRQLLDLLIT